MVEPDEPPSIGSIDQQLPAPVASLQRLRLTRRREPSCTVVDATDAVDAVIAL